MENKDSEWTSGNGDWVSRTAAPIGSRTLILDGIFEALMAAHKSYGDLMGTGTVSGSWIKEQIDQYDLATLDQDVRSHVKAAFEDEGVKVVG